ncbi:MAG TPA: hypothetical protein VGO13_06040 [Solirubrobacterales bacterium]|jgi:hypothetical protein|nr:hypothetical protein [Solirubrobacterales bacterium]
MFKRQPGKSESKDASTYSRRVAAVDSVWIAQDRVRNESGPALREGADRAKWPLEQTAYKLRKRVLWPLEDRAETMGRPARALATGAVVLLAVAAGVGGLIWAAPDGPHDTATTAVAVSDTTAPAAAPKTTPKQDPKPTLHGASPVFKQADTPVASTVDPAKAIVKSAPADATSAKPATTSDATATPSSSPKSSAQASSVAGPPAGPEAISVAREFAGTFVRYETGSSDPSVRQGFGATATPALAKALLRRPPRLPANVKVPKAKVVNVVPAPSKGTVYPVSVSLLRVGLTSELRLEMEQRKGDGWRVTNVLG